MLLAGGLGVLLFVLTLGHRLDYAGHYLAGFAGTLLVLTIPLALLTPALRWEPFGFACVAIGVGAILEATVFRLATFDLVDFASQSLGACVAAASVTGRPGSLRSSLVAGITSLAYLAVGTILAFA